MYNRLFCHDSEGASIVVIGQLISAGFTEQLYNPQCFMQYEDPRVPPPSWEVRTFNNLINQLTQHFCS